MNPILNKIIEDRKGHYCHVIEVSTVYEAEECISSLYGEFADEYKLSDIRDFFDTLQIIYFDEEEDIEEEERVHDFNAVDYLNEYLID